LGKKKSLENRFLEIIPNFNSQRENQYFCIYVKLFFIEKELRKLKKTSYVLLKSEVVAYK